MKKILSIILAITFLISLTACRSSSNTSPSNYDDTTSGFIDLDLVPEDENNNTDSEQDKTNSDNDTSSEENGDNLNNNSNNDPLSSNNSNPYGEDGVNSSYQNVDTNASPTKKPSSNTTSNSSTNNNTDNTNANPNANDLENDKNNGENDVGNNKDNAINKDNATNNTDKNNTTDKNTDKNNTADKNNNLSNNNDVNADNNLNNGDNNNANNTDKNNLTNNTDKDNTNNENNSNNNNGGLDENNTASNPENTPNKDNQTNTDNNVIPPHNNTSDPNGTNNNQNGENNENGNKGAYKDIVCKSISEWKTIELVSNNNSLYFSVNVPNDWSIDSNGIIKVNNQQIGQLCAKLTESFTNIYEEIKSENTISGTTASSSIREYNVNKQLLYKRIIKISKLGSDGNLANIYISADYSQLDNNATSKMLNSISDKNSYRPSPLLDKNSTKKILFLGNNNIENSKIEDYLSSMLLAGNKNIRTASKQPIGGAEVANFATNAIINDISTGEYSIVFINGFYTEANTVEPIKAILEACKKTNTMLILLPAYDDSDNIVQTILNTYPEIFCINWKNQIKSLITSNSSVSSSDFYSSANESSSELSGYVGAHLIYRIIFEENVPNSSDNLPLGIDKIKNLLPKVESKKDIFFIH